MSKPKWKRTRYRLHFRYLGEEGFESTVGPTWKHWGLRKESVGVVVTHIPSGRQIGTFDTFPKAKSFCEAIEPLASWGTLTHERAVKCERLRKKISSVMVGFKRVTP